MGVGVVWPVAATAASTLSDKPRWEKDIEPLVETAAWNPGTTVAPIPERHANLHGIFGYADRRLIQDIAFRYRAASKRNIGVNWPKSMERAREPLKKLNVFAQMLDFRIIALADQASRAQADEPAGQVFRLQDMAVCATRGEELG